MLFLTVNEILFDAALIYGIQNYKGDIKWSVIALMKDRALMYEGKPQIYGSQVSNGELHELFEPEYVNQRRAKIGMEPIEEYLQRFELEFNIEQKIK